MSFGQQDARARQKVLRAFRAVPWSIRIVLKTDDYNKTNVLQVKRVAQTITAEGIISTCDKMAKPQVVSTGACPFALCSDSVLDRALGILLYEQQDSTAVRVLLSVEEPESDEETTIPEPSQIGLRVSRKAKCVLSPGSSTLFRLEAVGVSSSVQWLIQARSDATLFVTAKVKERDGLLCFNALAFFDVSAYKADFVSDMEGVLGAPVNTLVDFPPTRYTLKKRLASIQSACSDVSDTLSFSATRDFPKRLRL